MSAGPGSFGVSEQARPPPRCSLLPHCGKCQLAFGSRPAQETRGISSSGPDPSRRPGFHCRGRALSSAQGPFLSGFCHRGISIPAFQGNAGSCVATGLLPRATEGWGGQQGDETERGGKGSARHSIPEAVSSPDPRQIEELGKLDCLPAPRPNPEPHLGLLKGGPSHRRVGKRLGLGRSREPDPMARGEHAQAP